MPGALPGPEGIGVPVPGALELGGGPDEGGEDGAGVLEPPLHPAIQHASRKTRAEASNFFMETLRLEGQGQ
jgi:hypothetical protein